MAKAAKIQGEAAADDLPAWFAEVLRVRFDEVLKFVDSALNPSETEGVHDMRVAIRRLRGVLRDYAAVVNKQRYAGMEKSLKKLADNLGVVRDLDVLIEELEGLGKGADESVVSGLRSIIEEYRGRRSSAHRSLAEYLTGELIFDLRRRFAATIEPAVRQRGLFDSADLREHGSIVVTKCLDEFLDLIEAIYHPTATKRIHKLRIAGKRLRYALDLYSPNFGDTLKPFAEQMKQMQSHLGDLHDCDVWIEEVRPHARRNRRKPDPAKTSAAFWLLAQFTRRRTKAYVAALERWAALEENSLAKSLRDAVSKTTNAGDKLVR